jgi:hypothetical protein
MQTSKKVLAVLVGWALFSGAWAGTYKCVVGGKNVYSDLPCAGNSARVDASTDSVSRQQRSEAERINHGNRSQLSDLERQATVDRYTPRQAMILESPVAPPASRQTPNYRGQYR